MEPPAKRLRILQSVEVDENDPAYIAAREKHLAKQKSKFDALFAKYEAIPEAMTDEIDMRTGEIVVDRGHMRRLERGYRERRGRGRKSGQLLDDLFAEDIDEEENYDDDEDDEDDDDKKKESARDELAPSKSPEPRIRKPAPKADAPPPCTPAGPPSIPNSSGAVVDWTQMVQFPQTPAGQSAQSAFMAQIAQTVQQAIATSMANLLNTTPVAQPQSATTTPATSNNANGTEAVIPPTGSALQFLPAPKSSDETLAFSSDSTPTAIRRPKRRFLQSVYIPAPRRKRVSTQAITVPENFITSHAANLPEVEENDGLADRVQTPNLQEHIDHTTKPDQSFQLPSSRVRRTTSPDESHHLPTPSSIEQDTPKDQGLNNNKLSEDVNEDTASGDHFDHDERDLLSISSANDYSEDLPVGSPRDDNYTKASITADDPDVILPSIELDAFMDEDNISASGTIAETVQEESVSEEPEEPVSAPTRAPYLSSAKKSRTNHQPINIQVYPESESDLDLIATSSPSKTARARRPSTCPTCNKTYTHQGFLRRHKENFHPTATAEEEVELLAPVPAPFTPIKRESLTPLSNSGLTILTAFHTPRTAPQPKTVGSSGAKEGSKLARSAFLKKVKQGWSKNKTTVKRRSFIATPRKRPLDTGFDDEDSEDELAG